MRRSYISVILIIFLSVLVVFYLGLMETGELLKIFHHGKDAEFSLSNAGSFGDSAGALNALFGSLAFGGVVLTIYWQIMESSRQSEDSHRSQFENVFFHMTGMLEQIVSGLKVIVNTEDMTDKLEESEIPELMMGYGSLKIEDLYRGTNKQPVDNDLITIEGRAVFKYIYQQAKNDGLTLREIIHRKGIEGYEETIDRQLDHYFRYFYRILKYIDTSKLIDDDEKYQYAGILRGQLSHFELLLIYYNGISCYGNEQLKPLIERYSILKNLRIEELANEDPYGGDINGIEEVYQASFNDPSKRQIMNRKKNSFAWNIVWAMLAACVFYYMVSDFWYDVVVKDVFSRVPDNSIGIAILLVCVALFIGKRSYDKISNVYYENNAKFRDVARIYIKKSYAAPLFVFAVCVIIPFAIKYSDMEWQGYGIPYVMMLVMLLLVKPVVDLSVIAYKTVTLKEEKI